MIFNYEKNIITITLDDVETELLTWISKTFGLIHFENHVNNFFEGRRIQRLSMEKDDIHDNFLKASPEVQDQVMTLLKEK